MHFPAPTRSKGAPPLLAGPRYTLTATARSSMAPVSLGSRGTLYYCARPTVRTGDGRSRRPDGRGRRPRLRLRRRHIRPSTPSSADLLQWLNRAYARPPVLTIALGAALSAGLFAGFTFGSSWGAAAVFAAAAVPVLGFAHWSESDEHSVVVLYELETEPLRVYRRLVGAFERFARSSGAWHLSVRRSSSGQRLARRRIRPRLGLPPRVKSNIRVPVLPAGRQTLYFFPDRVLVYEARLVWAVTYEELQVESSEVRVRESEKSRRGHGARAESARPGEERVATHGRLTLRGHAGLAEMFQGSDAGAVTDLATALAAMRLAPRPAPDAASRTVA